MKNRILTKLIGLGLVSSLISGQLLGCAGNASGNVENQSNETKLEDNDMKMNISAQAADLAIEVLKSNDEKNKLISPLSVMMAMGMAANGAEGDTRSELFGALSIGDEDSFNKAMKKYVKASGEEDSQLKVANGIWANADVSVEKKYEKEMEESFGARVKAGKFDSATLDDINGFVDKNTDGQIKKLYTELPSDASVILVDALSFQGKWEEPYEDYDLAPDSDFTSEDGSVSKVTMLTGKNHELIEVEGAKGFILPYEGGEYTFAALLPKEGQSVDKLLKKLDGEKLTKALNNPSDKTVHYKLPEFSFDYDLELSDFFMEKGAKKAFSGEADFSKMLGKSSGYFLSSVYHKTHITLDREGTRAAAATGVMTLGAPLELEYEEVNLDRPFVYMILDAKTNTPVFMGVCDEIK